MRWALDKRILYGQLLNFLSVLQVFAIQGFAAGFERSSNNQAVVKAELIAILNFQATPVKWNTGVYS